MKVAQVTIICDIHKLIGEEVEAETRTLKVGGRKVKRDLCDGCVEEYDLMIRVLAAR